MATWKVVVPGSKSSTYHNSQSEADEYASLIMSDWKIPAHVLPLTPCSACGGEREDDITPECNGCLMEMAKDYGD